MTSHIIKWMASVVLLASTTACNSGKQQEESGETTAATAYIQLNAEQRQQAGIEVGSPQHRSIAHYVECTGKVEVPPQSLASVYAPVAGFIKQVNFLPGDYVKKGALLAVISHPELVRSQREWLETKSKLAFLEQDYKRKETLAAADAASRRSMEEAKSEWELAQVRYKGLRTELELIGLPVTQIEKTGKIEEELHLHAPVAGYITKINVNLGKLVSPNELLYEIVDNLHLHLELQVFAKDIELLAPGQHISAEAPGTSKTYDAEVHLVGKMIDPETKTTMVHGHFLKEPVPLTPGAAMQARILTNPAEVLALPNDAVVREGGHSFVFVETKNGFEKKPIKTGIFDAEWIEVLDLNPGDKVALKGAYYLNGGSGD